MLTNLIVNVEQIDDTFSSAYLLQGSLVDKNIVTKFEITHSVKVKDAATPWIDAGAEKRLGSKASEPGLYASTAASPLMAVLYGARATRPDFMIAVLKGARRVCKWTKLDDMRLLKLLGYVRATAALGLNPVELIRPSSQLA